MLCVRGLIVVVCVLVGPAAGAVEDAVPSIGFRGNGHGVFPADCRPVLDWDEASGRNIVWRTPLPNYGNASPIVVGDRAFVMCEPGWPEGNDAPQLVCIDADSGEILWQRLVDHFAALPGGQSARAAALRRELYAARIKSYRAQHELRGMSGAKAEAHADQARKEGAIFLAKDDGKWSVLKPSGIGRNNPYRDTWEPKWEELKEQFHFHWPAWNTFGIGFQFATPVSDGEAVYVVTGFNAAACFDMDGSCRWLRFFGDFDPSGHDVGSFVHSPIIIDGVLIVSTGGVLRGIERSSGRTMWEVPTAYTNYFVGSPIGLTLGDTPCVLTAPGEVVRVRDGVVLTRNLAQMGGGAGPATAGEGVVFCSSGSTGGRYRPSSNRRFSESGMHCLRLQLQDGTLDVKRLWHNEEASSGEVTPVFLGDTLYVGSEGKAVDPRSGTVHGGRRTKTRAKNALVIAGGHLFLHDSYGETSVHRLGGGGEVATNKLLLAPSKGAKREQHIALRGKPVTEPGKWGYWLSCSVPFFSGNRIFIRTYDNLYAIGDRSAGFKPAQAFALRTEVDERDEDDAVSVDRDADDDENAGAEEEAMAGVPGGSVDRATQRAYDERLAGQVRAALQRGAQPRFELETLRREVMVTAIDDMDLELEAGSMAVTLPLSRIPDASKFNLAEATCARGDAAAHALTAFYAILAEERVAALRHLRAAGEEAAAVEAAFE